MSGQAKGTVFDRYGNQRSGTKETGSSEPSADDAVMDVASSQQQHAGRGAVPALHVISGESDDEPLDTGVYKAAFLYKSRTRPRLRLHYANGLKVKVLSYAYLVEVVSTSHQWLTLVFSSAIITLKGRHLDALVESLQDERVRALVCYRPGIHPTPARDEPCILEIIERSAYDLMTEDTHNG